MNFYCVADEDTVRGFRLAGVEGQAVTSAAAAAAAVESAIARPECGVIIITERVAGLIRPLVDRICLEGERPLMLEIAGPEGALKGRKSLRELVQEAVGLRMEPEKGT